jgi:photosystem II stability/assembly factor-like uncharacterized protein
MNRTKKILFGSAAFIAAAFGIYTTQESDSVYSADKDANVAEGYKGASEYLYNMRKNWATNSIDLADVERARQEASLISKNAQRSLDLEWNERGPDNIGGRTRAIIFDKDNPDIMLAAGVGGGVFYTNSGGTSWFKIDNMDELDNIAVASMVQDNDGFIYFGTGEGFYQNTGDGSGGFEGAGIFKSDQTVASMSGNLSTMTFTKLPTTWTPSAQSAFVNVNKMVFRPQSNEIFAATARGLRVSADGGATWDNPLTIGALSLTATAHDVEIDSDGGVHAVSGNGLYYSPDGSHGTFTKYSSDVLPLSSPSRVEVEVAPSNSDYIYVLEIASDESLGAAYRSTDGGQSFEEIGSGGTDTFSPMGSSSQYQGFYDTALGVDPFNPNKILVGGVELWKWENGLGWERISSEFQYPGSSVYVHSDKHVIEYHPTNPNYIYLGSDGGVGRSKDGGETFETLNRQYNVTQFYSVAFDKLGNVMGGTQDNSNHYLAKGNMSSVEMYSGDGAYTAISHLNEDALFMSSQYGNVGRSSSRGVTVQTGTAFITDLNLGTSSTPISFDNSFAAFVAPFRLWEKEEDLTSTDFIQYIVQDSITPMDSSGAVAIRVPSNTSTVSFDYTVTEALVPGDTISIQDPVQSKFFLGLSSGLWLTRDALNFSRDPKWINLSAAGSAVKTIEYSTDGDVVYYGDVSGNLYRVSNVSAVKDSLSGEHVSDEVVTDITRIGVFSQDVTGIAVDPNDADHVIITLGGYGNYDHVYETETATTDSETSNNGSFSSIDGNLPTGPVYDALINYENSNQILLGTEFGVYSTTNGVTWAEEGNNFPPVPTFMLVQQTRLDAANLGYIYAATHGRGIFETATLVGIEEEDKEASAKKSYDNLIVFPNPTSDYANVELNLTQRETLTIEVMDLAGKLVQSDSRTFNAGAQNIQLDVRELPVGNYVVRVKGETTLRFAKLLVK